MKLREINQTEQRVSQVESKKILSDIMDKLEGGYCVVVGREKAYYERLGNELLKEWQHLSSLYPYISSLIPELKERLERIKNNQLDGFQIENALADCEKLLKEC